MGKTLKGKECGKGIYQRKDGLFQARFVDKYGHRNSRCFNTLPEARNWLEDSRYSNRHAHFIFDSHTTVDAWFEFWKENIVCDLSPNTIRNYQDRYTQNIKPFIGKMKLCDVKPMHCKMILNKMNKDYAGSTIRQTFIAMGTLFRSAVDNNLIIKHPMDGVRYTKPVRAVNDIKYLTTEEQKLFLEAAKNTHNYNQFALILETGLRTGEMIGLTWDAIDWDNRTLTVNKTLEYRHSQGFWRAGPPKTQSSYRTIPLTDNAYCILASVYSKRNTRKISDSLPQKLEYIDRYSGKTMSLDMKNLVFINYRTGEPTKNSSYDTYLYKLCDKAGIKRFCMHALRHTYATRAIEAGMSPKVLQKLLGHASLSTTMDRYVHVTDDSLKKAVKLFGETVSYSPSVPKMAP